MERIKEFLGGLFASSIGIGFMVCGTLGWACWMWMAIKLGSFGMFFSAQKFFWAGLGQCLRRGAQPVILPQTGPAAKWVECQPHGRFPVRKGAGVPQNYAEALNWYRKAAEQGDAVAQHSLGEMYEWGRSIRPCAFGRIRADTSRNGA